ncbi:MAG: (2Fe-2S)-binding protein [Spirochaetes bacterium]|nr:(2Fe-2S)-binding protein [Spirochaetota bacterium]
MIIKLIINNEEKEFTIKPGDILLDVLRREGYKGVKKGCGTGECGACAVLLNGRAVNSCLVLAAEADNSRIVTIEGIGTTEKPDPLQESFVEAGAVQCGYCTPGMIISAKALLNKKKDPTDTEIKKALDGNYCRCTGYVKIIDAVRMAVKKMKNK